MVHSQAGRTPQLSVTGAVGGNGGKRKTDTHEERGSNRVLASEVSVFTCSVYTSST